MTTSLTPELALAYMRALSADVIAGIVLDAAGERLAGPSELTAPALVLLAAHPEAGELHGATERGHAFAARDAEHAIVVAAGRFALPGVARLDVRTALAALGGESAQESSLAVPDPALVRALLAAAEDPFRRHSVNLRSD